MMQSLEGRVPDLETKGVTACLSGLSHLRLRPSQLLIELELACVDHVRNTQVNMRELAAQLEAFAELGAEAAQLCHAVEEHDQSLAKHRKLDTQSTISLLWAMTVLGIAPGALAEVHEEAVFALAPSHGMSDRSLVQLYQVCSWCAACFKLRFTGNLSAASISVCQFIIVWCCTGSRTLRTLSPHGSLFYLFTSSQQKRCSCISCMRLEANARYWPTVLLLLHSIDPLPLCRCAAYSQLSMSGQSCPRVVPCTRGVSKLTSAL
jgi:hypothetical protein